MQISSSSRWTPVRVAAPHVKEIALVVGAYFTYMFVRQIILSDFRDAAFENARQIVSIEKQLGFFWESGWQSWAINSAEALVIFFNWAYIFTFLPIVITSAIILYIFSRRRYRYFRNVVMLSFAFALLMFAIFPLAPPRMLSGQFVDTIDVFGPSFYASREFAAYYNAFAAMPSLHFSWTVIFGVMFFQSGNRVLRVLAFVYPTLTLFAITITGNHYLLDAVGGGVVMLASFGTVYFVRRQMELRRRKKQLAEAPFTPADAEPA